MDARSRHLSAEPRRLREPGMDRDPHWVSVAELEHWSLDPARCNASFEAGRAAVLVILGTWSGWQLASGHVGLMSGLPAITVAICTSMPVEGHEIPLLDALAACDLRVCVADLPQRHRLARHRDWNLAVACEADARTWVSRLSSRADRLGPAALTCAHVIRLTARIAPAQALAVESIAYGMLQGSASHRQWLTERVTR